MITKKQIIKELIFWWCINVILLPLTIIYNIIQNKSIIAIIVSIFYIYCIVVMLKRMKYIKLNKNKKED